MNRLQSLNDHQTRRGGAIGRRRRVREDRLSSDARCPSGVEAKVGGQFDCPFTGPEGKHYTANMRITKVEGEQVVFDVKSRPR